MEKKLEEIRAEYRLHAAEVGHRARLMKRITQEVQFHEAKMEAAAKEEEALLARSLTVASEEKPKESA